MSRWADSETRKQREAIIIQKRKEKWTIPRIASYIGIKSGSVARVLRKVDLREGTNESSIN